MKRMATFRGWLFRRRRAYQLLQRCADEVAADERAEAIQAEADALPGGPEGGTFAHRKAFASQLAVPLGDQGERDELMDQVEPTLHVLVGGGHDGLVLRDLYGSRLNVMPNDVYRRTDETRHVAGQGLATAWRVVRGAEPDATDGDAGNPI